MDIIGLKIKDTRLLDLIRKALKAGYMESTTYLPSLVGTPQGSILSPLLSNIYLNELDKFLTILAEEFNKGKSRKRNPEYLNLQYQKRKAKTIEEKIIIHKKMLTIPSLVEADNSFRRLLYIRYADD